MATEAGIIEPAEQPGLTQNVVTLAHALLDHFIGPAHVAILQQRDEIIAKRTYDHVLKIDDGEGAVSRGRLAADHQVAAVEVPVHHPLGLGQVVGGEAGEGIV
ncbi:hypothetical protein D3C79_970410 [compost metagenome]